MNLRVMEPGRKQRQQMMCETAHLWDSSSSTDVLFHLWNNNFCADMCRTIRPLCGTKLGGIFYVNK